MTNKRIESKDSGFGFKYKEFELFSGVKVSQGGWLIGKWITAAHMNKLKTEWVKRSYVTRADNWLKQRKGANHDLETGIDIRKLREIDREYDLTAGCAQCGGCRWFAALDGDYGLCFCESSPNEGRITFEHGGCIQHSFIQELLNKMESGIK